MKYKLRVPFTCPSFTDIEIGINTIQHNDLTMELKRDGQYYVLIVTGFDSEIEAKNYFNNIWAGLMNLLICRGIYPIVETNIQDTSYVDKPIHMSTLFKGASSDDSNESEEGMIDGMIDGSMPAVYPSDKRIGSLRMNAASVKIINKSEDILKLIVEGAGCVGSSCIIKNLRLHTALELFGAYYIEETQRAKFLTLVMALEALATGSRKTELVLQLIEKWKSELNKLVENSIIGTDDYYSLVSLQRTMIFSSEDSIRNQIRLLVKNTLTAIGDSDADLVADEAVKIYDTRSRLVHEGWIEPKIFQMAFSGAQKIVKRVLQAKYEMIIRNSQ